MENMEIKISHDIIKYFEMFGQGILFTRYVFVLLTLINHSIKHCAKLKSKIYKKVLYFKI